MAKIRVLIWNLRFNWAWRLLPSEHKHVAIVDKGESCERCEYTFANLED